MLVGKRKRTAVSQVETDKQVLFETPALHNDCNSASHDVSLHCSFCLVLCGLGERILWRTAIYGSSLQTRNTSSRTVQFCLLHLDSRCSSFSGRLLKSGGKKAITSFCYSSRALISSDLTGQAGQCADAGSPRKTQSAAEIAVDDSVAIFSLHHC